MIRDYIEVNIENWIGLEVIMSKEWREQIVRGL